MTIDTTPRAGRTYAAVLACFFFSGASALVYQVVWVRMLGLLFGATAIAVSTVLAAFMAGLALGSWLFGRAIDRRGHPLAVYGILELGIGLFAVVFPLLLSASNEIYRPVYAGGEGNPLALVVLRFALAFLLLLLPTTLMGGTLPVLTRMVVTRWGEMGKRLGTLYSVNTWGAVAGAFGSGFFLLPYFGLTRSVAIAVTANVLVGAGALFLWRRHREAADAAQGGTRAEVRDAAENGPARWTAGWPILLAFGVSGMVALVLEVVWTRLLAMILGTTTYAFTTMLATFLLGIAVGSLVISRVLDRARNLVVLFGYMEAGLGLAALGALFLFGRFPEMFLRLHWAMGGGWWGSVGIKFLLASAAMFVPTFFMGTTFPLVAKIYARDLRRVGGGVGTAYACNTLGAIAGSFAGGFFFLPVLGVERSTAVVALLAIAVGIVLLGPASGEYAGRRRVLRPAAVAAAALALLLSREPWDPMTLTRGVYVYAPQYHQLSDLRRILAQTTLLSYAEEPGGTVSVERIGGRLAMRIDGKVDASNSADMITQVTVAHLPLLLHPHARSVLVVGLGSGVTVGSVEQHPVSEIECVELSPGVVRASEFFGPDNHWCLRDPRLRLLHGDGRNHVLLTPRTYDVIISQPSNPWISGIGSLFTQEFFRLARARLAPGGLMCQWFQSYQMSSRDFRATVHTFRETFPYMTLWTSSLGDVVMVGSAEPLAASWSEVRGRFARESVRADLARVGVRSVEAFLSMFLMDSEGVGRYAGATPVLHTDDNLLLEFSASRNLFRDTSHIHLEEMLPHRQRVTSFLTDGAAIPAASREDLDRRFRARERCFAAQIERGRGEVAAAAEMMGEAWRLAPDDPFVASAYAEIQFLLGNLLLQENSVEEAGLAFERAVHPEIAGFTYSVLQNLGAVYFQRGEMPRALAVWSEAARIDDGNPDLHYNMGQALAALGREDEAIERYETAILRDPRKAEALNNLAWIYAETGRELDRALELSRRAVALEPSATHYDTLGWTQYRCGDYRAAIDALRHSVKKAPGQAEAYLHLGLAYRDSGDRAKAREALQAAIAKDRPGGPFRARAETELTAL